MFTLDQIKTAHATVKSGADFPAYIQLMKGLGVRRYEHHVADAHVEYYGADNFTISSDAKWAPVAIAEPSSPDKLKHALTIHQAGQTTYPTFCADAAQAGVDKWTVDIDAMTCTYYDKVGNNMLEERIPQV